MTRRSQETKISPDRALPVAVQAAEVAGAVMRRHLRSPKRIASATQHDIKLELDVRCQRLINRTLRRAFPAVPVLGEEGTEGDLESAWRWVVDPIDGTVNFSYGIPHASVSIALQTRSAAVGRPGYRYEDGYVTVLGVVYDPFCRELWTAVKGRSARLNGRSTTASRRAHMGEAIISVGFAKQRESLEHMLPVFRDLVHRVRKLRLMGSAALALTYVASGRMDGYLESGVRLWDIAAGGLILECAGGRFWRETVSGSQAYRVAATNDRLHRTLKAFA